MQELGSAVRTHQHLKEQLQQHDIAAQHLQQQLYAAVQHMDHMQQQALQQAVKTYKSAVQSSTERLQELKDRYFNSTPTDAWRGGKQAGSNALKLQRENIVSAYNDFQQRHGTIQSMASIPAAGTSSPSSSLRRGTWAGSSQGILQQAWPQLSPHGDSPSRGLNASSRFMDSRKSFAVPVSRTSSFATHHRQGMLEQPLNAGHGSVPSSVSRNSSMVPQQQDSLLHTGSYLPSRQGSPRQSFAGPSTSTQTPPQSTADAQSVQQDSIFGSLHPQHAEHATAAVPPGSDAMLDYSSWNILEMQPEPSWLMPLVQQVMQFEACLLTVLMGLLTEQPSASSDHGGQRVEDKRKGQVASARQQVWPKAAEKSQQTAEDTTGRLVCTCPGSLGFCSESSKDRPQLIF